MSSSDTPGVIEPGRLYAADEARRRLRLGDLGWKRLRDAGLPVVRRGRSTYVFGDDLIALIGREREPVTA